MSSKSHLSPSSGPVHVTLFGIGSLPMIIEGGVMLESYAPNSVS